VPTAAEAAALYGDAYFVTGEGGGYLDYAADEPLHRANARDRLAVIEAARAGEPGRLLDVGCAHGFFLDEARRRGWDVTGIEIAGAAATYARDRLGIEVHDDLELLAPSRVAAFDVVTLFQVVAHLVDPRAALSRVHELVTPGGLAVVETPNRGSRAARLLGRHWHLATPPSIVCMFDPSSLTSLLRSTGFDPIHRQATAKAVSLGFVGSTLAHKYPRALGPVGALTARPALARRRVRVALGDVLTIVARRLGATAAAGETTP
jgi:SAM-dependent methyltransferase